MSAPVIFEVKHRGELWRLRVETWQARTSVHWRKWYRDQDGGEWKATRTGVTFPLEELWTLTANLMAHHGLPVPDRPDSSL